MFKIGTCRICEKNCLWIPMVDGVLADVDVCSEKCLEVLLDNMEKELRESISISIEKG